MEEEVYLEEVYWDNVRANQIGGVVDGVSPEVAGDLGYQNPGEIDKLKELREERIRREIIEHIRRLKNQLDPTHSK
jgi:hypothetical protein